MYFLLKFGSYVSLIHCLELAKLFGAVYHAKFSNIFLVLLCFSVELLILLM